MGRSYRQFPRRKAVPLDIWLVQSAALNATGSVTVTPTTTPKAGNLIVLTVGLLDAVSTVTVPAGFQAVTTAPAISSTTWGQMYWKVSDGSQSSFTVSKSGTVNDVRVVLLEYSGTDLISPFDQSATAGSGGVSVVTLAGGSITPTVKNSVAVVFTMVTGASNTWTSWTNGFASENNANLHRNETADRILIGASGAYSTTGTWTATGTAVQVIANFKVAGSSPSPSSWIHPVNQPIRRTKRQQPQYYGQFWSQDREFIVPTLDAWARTVNQPIRKSKRQQPGPNQKPFVPTVTPIVPTGWPEPIVQPRIVRKRQQPQYYGQFWAQDKVFIIPTLEAWVQPTNQPLRSRIRRPQQPQCYGTFWAQNQEFIVPGLESWMRPTNQPVRGRRRLQVVKVGVFTATLTVAPVVPFGWQEPTTQPRIVKKRQQPQYGKPAPLRTGESPLISLWKHETNQPIKSRTPKRQQPQGYGNPFYDIPKQAVPVLNAWVQPVNQPQRRTYVKRQQPQVFVGGWQKASNTLAANNKTSVIFLTDGRIAVRLSKNIYMPL